MFSLWILMCRLNSSMILQTGGVGYLIIFSKIKKINRIIDRDFGRMLLAQLYKIDETSIL